MLPGLCACQEVNRFGKPTLILFPLGRTRFVLALVGRYRFGRPTPIDLSDRFSAEPNQRRYIDWFSQDVSQLI